VRGGRGAAGDHGLKPAAGTAISPAPGSRSSLGGASPSWALRARNRHVEGVRHAIIRITPSPSPHHSARCPAGVARTRGAALSITHPREGPRPERRIRRSAGSRTGALSIHTRAQGGGASAGAAGQGEQALTAALDGVADSRTFDRTDLVWTLWMPRAAEGGPPALWPNSPPLPAPVPALIRKRMASHGVSGVSGVCSQCPRDPVGAGGNGTIKLRLLR
jgi:hypothetical protein